jgi:hypothetical protein
MRPSVLELLERLVERSRREGGVDIDAIGDAVTPLGMSPAEIEELMNAFDARGGVVHAPSASPGENAQRLKIVLTSARALTSVLGRRPTVLEIAEHSGLEVLHVRHALAVGRVMGR